eukprot:41105-Eustigmatos_ZCMA.PRE.1
MDVRRIGATGEGTATPSTPLTDGLRGDGAVAAEATEVPRRCRGGTLMFSPGEEGEGVMALD